MRTQTGKWCLTGGTGKRSLAGGTGRMRAWTVGMLTVLAMLLVPSAWAAQVNIKGCVKDASGEPLIGVTVLVKGTAKGTSTDIDGNYTLTDVADNATLTFTYVGYKQVNESVKGRTTIDIMMSEDSAILNEVVVVGYGSLSRKEVSSSIVQVDKKDFNQGAMNNAMEMISGKVAGLNVSTQAAANPNGSSSLQIRGAASLNAGSEPLIVIDGVAGGNLRNLSPQDIESMSVLKDAASAAIYGTRGANGVILVTTKKGSGTDCTPTITYDSYVSMAWANDKPEVLSASEWRLARRGNDYGASTDWYDQITRDYAYDTNQYLSIDGGLAKGGYYSASVNWKKANGLDIASGREEFGGRAAVSANAVDNHLRFSATLNARRVKEKYGNDGMFDTALGMNPTIPVYNSDGSFYQATSPSGIWNPVGALMLTDNRHNRTYLLGTADVRYNIFSDEHNSVSTTLSYSYQLEQDRYDYYTPSNSSESYWAQVDGIARIENNTTFTNGLEWIANYNWHNDWNDIKFVGGYSYTNTQWEGNGMSNQDFPYDSPKYWGIGTGTYLSEGKATMWAGKSEYTIAGFFGRVNYAWKNMLFAAASVRYEGCSKFGVDRKWGTFPSVSVAWEIAEMPFMQPVSDVVQSIKPRISYGETGRCDFDPYLTLVTYSPTNNNYLMDGEWVPGYNPTNNSNPLLAWEKATSLNIGVDFMFWNRLHGSIEYFDRRSKDLLYTYTAPQPPYIYNDIMVNVGTIKNYGVELSLTGDIVVNQPFTYSTTVNYAYGQTKMTKLSNDIYKAAYVDLYQKAGMGTTEYYFRVEEGGKVGQFFGFEAAGLDEFGNIMIYNKDGEIVPASSGQPDDKRYIGNGAPEHFLSWNNNMAWKGWDLSLNFSGAFGFDIFNVRRANMGYSGSGSDNVLRSSYLKDRDVKNTGGVISSYFLERGDYFKLDNVTLGYTFNFKNRKIMDKLRLYLSAKNLFTLTKYTGKDPSMVPSTGITPGVDASDAYPSATQLAFGVTLSFR